MKLPWVAVLAVAASFAVARSDGQGLKERATIEAHSVIYDDIVLREYFEPERIVARKIGGLLFLRQGPRSVTRLAFSPDGKVLASASQRNGVSDGHDDPLMWSSHNTIKLWNVATAKKIANLEGHIGEVRSMAFSPDGKTLISASLDAVVNFWDPNRCEKLTSFDQKTLKRFSYLNSMAFAPDGKSLATTQGLGETYLWNLSGNIIREFTGTTDRINCLDFSPDGKMLLSANSNRTMSLWEVSSGKQRALLDAKSAPVFHVTFSPDGKLFASGASYSVKIWSTSTCKELAALDEVSEYVRCLAFSPDSKLIAAGGSYLLMLWDLRTGKPMHHVLQADRTAVCSVAFSPDGKTLAAGLSDGTIKLWDMPVKTESK